LRIIKNTHHEEINLEKIPLNDVETFSCSPGRNHRSFQLESNGMKEILKRLNPSNIEDLTAILALYRPGPLGMVMMKISLTKTWKSKDRVPASSTGAYPARDL
jgi:DNA polymerase-3 subunit alpha